MTLNEALSDYYEYLLQRRDNIRTNRENATDPYYVYYLGGCKEENDAAIEAFLGYFKESYFKEKNNA